MKFLASILSNETLDKLNGLLGEQMVSEIDQKTEGFEIDFKTEKMMPKSIYDGEKKKLEDLIKDRDGVLAERDTQLKSLSEAAKGNDELTKKLKELEAANVETQRNYEAKLTARAKEYAVDTYLVSNGVRNLKAVKANLNLDGVTYDADKLGGLEEQVKALKDSDGYLFVDVSKNDKAGIGVGGSNPPPASKNYANDEAFYTDFFAAGKNK